MSTDEQRIPTSGHYFLRVLLVLLALLLVLSVGATLTLVDSAAAENGSVPENATFDSFAVEFDAAAPEQPTDVTVRWSLSANATNVDAVRIAISNESGAPVTLYAHRGPDVPNPFTVAETESATADLRVSDLSSAELQLKVPPAHCERVDTVQVFVVDGSGDGSASNASTEPALERSIYCGDGRPSHFTVAIDDYDDPVHVGENATVNATVTNTGDRETTQSVRFLVDGVERDRVTLTLGPNETARVSFAVEPTAAEVGDLPVAVETDDDRANRTLTVIEAPTPTFSVAIGNTTAPVAAGETLSVTARVENTGNASGTQSIALTDVDGDVVDVAENVSLAANESTTVRLNWSTNDSDVGTGNVSVHSANETANASVTVTTAAVESVSVTLANATITTAENTSVRVEATYTNGTIRTVTDGATITVTNETVATVQGATVVGRNPGSTQIVASFANETDAAPLTVESQNSNATDSGGGPDDSTDTDDSTDSTDSADQNVMNESTTDAASGGENLTDTNESVGDDLAGDDAGDVGGEDADPVPAANDEDDAADDPELPEDGPTPVHDEPDSTDGVDWPTDGPVPPTETPDPTSEPATVSTTDGGGTAAAEATTPSGGAVDGSTGRRLALLPFLVVLLVPVLLRARRSWISSKSSDP